MIYTFSSCVLSPCYLFVVVVCSVRLVGRLNCVGCALRMDQMPRTTQSWTWELRFSSWLFNEGVA